jgi:hypothetical protein
VTRNSFYLDRRRLLFGSAALAISTYAGCDRQASEISVASKPERRDVPLRVALFGSDHDAESIRRGWGAVTEQPLEIQTIPLSRDSAAELADLMMAAAKKNDLLIYPLLLVAEASAAEAIVALSDSELEEMEQKSGALFSALRNGVARYAGQYYSVPLGASLPALLSVDDVGPLDSWEAYDELVEQAWDGLAAEPSAPGWAGAMFLWRTATPTNWLFNRDDLRPLVDTEHYVESLRLMIQTHAKYRSTQRTPEQIWSAVREGQLKGGIGFPQKREKSEGELSLSYPPGASETSRVLLDPFSPVVSLSANCRQSAAAKRFIEWISGGEGGQSVRQQVLGMTDIRRATPGSGQSDAVSGGIRSYDSWLADRLRSPLTLPTVQILRAGQYYQALDSQVRRALDGQSTPADALSNVAEQWQAATEQAGLKKQLREWRRAQGMRA